MKRIYYVNKKEVPDYVFEGELRKLISGGIAKETIEGFDDLLDELYKPYDNGHFTVYFSEILKKCRPGDYDIWLDDQIEAMIDEKIDDLELSVPFDYNGVSFNIEKIEEE